MIETSVSNGSDGVSDGSVKYISCVNKYTKTRVSSFTLNIMINFWKGSFEIKIIET